MKSPQGFGKKYFTLSSIQAHSVAITLHSVITSAKNHLTTKLKISSQDEKEEESPPNLQENILSLLVQNKKPCHCDGFYKRKTSLAIRLFKFIPRCPYYTTYFAFRRTGVHPPFYNYLYNKLKSISF